MFSNSLIKPNLIFINFEQNALTQIVFAYTGVLRKQHKAKPLKLVKGNIHYSHKMSELEHLSLCNS